MRTMIIVHTRDEALAALTAVRASSSEMDRSRHLVDGWLRHHKGRLCVNVMERCCDLLSAYGRGECTIMCLGSYKNRLRDRLDAKKKRLAKEALYGQSFATFQ